MQIAQNLKMFSSDGGYRVIIVFFYFSMFIVSFFKNKNFRNYMTVAQGLPVMVFPMQALDKSNLFILEVGQMCLWGIPVDENTEGHAAAGRQS